MGIVNRVLLLIYSLAVACLSVGVVGLALHLVPDSILLNEYRYLLESQKWSLVFGSAFVFLLSIHLIGCGFSSGSKEHNSREFLVLHTKTGEVSISLDAIHSLVEQTAKTVLGVRSIKVLVLAAKKAAKEITQLRLRLFIVIGKETNAAAVSDGIRTEIRRYMKNTIGVDDYTLEIIVEDISNAPLAKKKRVI